MTAFERGISSGYLSSLCEYLNANGFSSYFSSTAIKSEIIVEVGIDGHSVLIRNYHDVLDSDVLYVLLWMMGIKDNLAQVGLNDPDGFSVVLTAVRKGATIVRCLMWPTKEDLKFMDELTKMSVQSRMAELRHRYQVMKESEKLEAEARGEFMRRQELAEKAAADFNRYREDTVGDLFNGCFGQEWSLK